MKKQTLIVVIICVLVAVVIGLSVSGVIGTQGSVPTASLAGLSDAWRATPSSP